VDVRVPAFLVLLRPFALVLRLAVVRFAVAFLPPERDAVLRLAVLRFAVDFLPPDRPLDRLAVDFFVDFFFAAICPPLGCAINRAA
jgi:hypothetical protein